MPEQVVASDRRNVNLGHVEQQRLSVTINSTANAVAEGRVETLEVNNNATGNANLGHLAARHVIVNLAGAGNVTVAPTDDVKINITGSGNVRLATRLARIERNITDNGRILEMH